MSKVLALYLVHHTTLSREKCSWRREYFRFTVKGRLSSVSETEDKVLTYSVYKKLWLPAGCVLSTKADYQAARLRYRQDAAERKRLAELEKLRKEQMQEGIDIARGFKPARTTPAPLLVVEPEPEPALPAGGLFDDFTIVDTEYQGEHLLEVAAVRYKNWVEVDRYVSFVRFTEWIWPRISETTGIYARHVERAPLEREVLQKFIDLAEGSLLIAHNVGADRGKFEHACRRQGRAMLPNKWFCTLALARTRLPPKTPCGLEELCNRFKFSNKGAHRAMSDVLRTFQVLRHFQQEDPLTSLDPKARKAAPQLFPA